jgi:hypothetical protein
MAEFNQREYQAVILGALLHVNRSRIFGDVGKEGDDAEKNYF